MPEGAHLEGTHLEVTCLEHPCLRAREGVHPAQAGSPQGRVGGFLTSPGGIRRRGLALRWLLCRPAPARYHDHRCRRPQPLPQVTSHLPDAPTAPGLLSPFTRHLPSPTYATEAAPRFPGLAPAADPRGRSRPPAGGGEVGSAPSTPRGPARPLHDRAARPCRAGVGPGVHGAASSHAGRGSLPRRLRDLRLFCFPCEEENETAVSGRGIWRQSACPGGFRSAQTQRGPHMPPSQTPGHAGAQAPVY